MRKIKLLTWAVIFLAVMNLATIATILYHNYNERRQTEEVVINTGDGSNPLSGMFFRQQLGFDAAQMDLFREANSHFRPAAFEITAAIDSLKGSMFTELQKTAPDSILLDKLAGDIGSRHSSLKKETYQFYLQLKKLCNTQQLTQLDKAFRPLFINDEITTPFNRRQRNGRGKQFFNK